MKKIIMACWAIWQSLAFNTVQAQSNGKISGRVVSADNKGIETVTAMLMRVADSSIVKTALTDADGYFLFEGLVKNVYKLQLTMTGYEMYTHDITLGEQNISLPPVQLKKQEKTLGEVTVTARKPFVEKKIDRTVVNVDALISNAGTTALDVLEKSPGVLVDQNGTITLKGKQGVVVFIDDKPTYLSAADLQNYLRSLPSSALEQIELMPNPPAKYDAAGTGGVINIRTKKSRLKGFNGNLSLGYNQGSYARTNNSLNLNWRQNKFNFFANLGFNRQNNFSDLDINRRYKNDDESTRSYFLQNSFIRRKGNSFTGKAGVDFYQDAKTTWGIVLTGQSNNMNITNNNISNLLNAAGQRDSMIRALNSEKQKFKNAGINFNYRRQIDKSGHDLTFDLDYINYKTDNDQLFDNASYDANDNLKIQDYLNGKLPANIDIYSAKTDYTKPLKGGYHFSAGLKSSYTKTDNLAEYYYTINNSTSPDYDKSNHFIYKENINAAYVNLSKDFARLSVQLGLRFENTISEGDQLGNAIKPDSSFRRDYNNLFPTVYLTYKLDSASNHQLALNYGRRINRPAYRDMNPFISPLDKFTFYVGNPFLKPAFIDNIEFSYTFRQRITATLSYGKTHNSVGETIEIVDGTYYSRPGNLSSVEIKSISLDGSQDIAKWLTLNLYTELTSIHSRSNFYTGLLNTKGTLWYIGPNAQFKFNKGWSAELSGIYRTDITTGQFISGGFSRVNIGVQKKLSLAATLKLSVNDIFYTQINKGIINNLAQTDANYHNLGDTRYFALTFSWRFGKTIADQRKHNATGAEAEQNRVR
ncbi:MAG TPA: outer membrane beta-barrel protein [Chitinophagaceae bacterium]|nr:outer membrane beta-barrel protein [Chitinophagaceae bacterium]